MPSIISSNLKLGKRKPWWLGKSSERQRGETSTSAKLTEDDVMIIRSRAKRGERSVDIVLDYPFVTREAIGSIIRGVTWKHLLEQSDGQ